jgi:hypothetical protein
VGFLFVDNFFQSRPVQGKRHATPKLRSQRTDAVEKGAGLDLVDEMRRGNAQRAASY